MEMFRSPQRLSRSIFKWCSYELPVGLRENTLGDCLIWSPGEATSIGHEVGIPVEWCCRCPWRVRHKAGRIRGLCADQQVTGVIRLGSMPQFMARRAEKAMCAMPLLYHWCARAGLPELYFLFSSVPGQLLKRFEMAVHGSKCFSAQAMTLPSTVIIYRSNQHELWTLNLPDNCILPESWSLELLSMLTISQSWDFLDAERRRKRMTCRAFC